MPSLRLKAGKTHFADGVIHQGGKVLSLTEAQAHNFRDKFEPLKAGEPGVMTPEQIAAERKEAERLQDHVVKAAKLAHSVSGRKLSQEEIASVGGDTATEDMVSAPSSESGKRKFR